MQRAGGEARELSIRIEIVAVPGEEREALSRTQRAAIVDALMWAAVNQQRHESVIRPTGELSTDTASGGDKGLGEQSPGCG